jgi:hypothetical protein
MILVDTSVWVDHLRRRNAALVALLEHAEVLTHPFVIGEIALGAPKDRAQVITLLEELPGIPAAPHADVLALVERRGLGGAGIGWVDAHLLASAVVDRVPLWTLDRRLALTAVRLGVGWDRRGGNGTT